MRNGVKNSLIAIDLRLFRNSLRILHNKEKNVCEQCGEKFTKYEYLISHARHIHNHPLVNSVGAARNPSMKK
jgi:hypothetical protein